MHLNFKSGLAFLLSAIGYYIIEKMLNMMELYFTNILPKVFANISILDVFFVVIASIGIIIMIHSKRVEKEQSKNSKTSEFETRKSPIEEVLKTIDDYRKEWLDRRVFRPRSYRKQILNKEIWTNRSKIREYSQRLHRGIGKIKQSGTSNESLSSLENIANRMSHFGTHVEDTFHYGQFQKEAMKIADEVIKQLISEGDGIYSDLTNIIPDIENLES